MVTEAAAVVDRVRSDPNIAFFRCNRQWILLRADGLVIVIPKAVWTVFTSKAPHRHASSAVGRCILELERAGVLDTSALPRHFSFSPPRRGSGLVLMVTDRCNLSCRYCYGDGGAYGCAPAGAMSRETALAAVDSMLQGAPAARRYSIVFFGGEPLLNYRLVRDVAEYCEQRVTGTDKRVRYSITTNGTVMTPEIAAFLARHRFNVLVSCDGPPEWHDRLRPFRNGLGSSARVRKTVQTLLAAGLNVQMRTTLVHGSITGMHLKRVMNEARSLGVRQMHSCPVDCNRFDHPDLELDGTENSRLQTVYEGISREHLDWVSGRTAEPPRVVFEPHLSLVRRLVRGVAPNFTRCGACAGMTAVATDGTLFPCHRFVGWQPYSIGHVDVGIDSARVKRLYSSLSAAYTPKCDSCAARLLCGGSCYYHTADGTGGFRAPNSTDCQMFLRSLRFAIRVLVQLRLAPPEARKRYARLTAPLSS